MFLHLILGAIAVLAAPQHDTVLPFGSLDRGNALQVRAPFDLRSILEGGTAGDLEARQSCPGGYVPCGSNRCMPSGSTCCSNGRSCRAGTDCVATGGCCDKGTVGCDATDGSGHQGCYPASQGAQCCSNGRYCDSGTYCVAGGCCQDGRICTGGGGGGGGGGAPPAGGAVTSTSTRTAPYTSITAATPFTPNPNPNKCGLSGQSTKVVDFYWEVKYVGVWMEYTYGQCDKNQKARTAKGSNNIMSIEFEDDVRAFSLSLSVQGVGDVQITSGGVAQNISILDNDPAWDVVKMDTCPITYTFAFPEGSTGNTMSLEYLRGFNNVHDEVFYVHQMNVYNNAGALSSLLTTAPGLRPSTIGAGGAGVGAPTAGGGPAVPTAGGGPAVPTAGGTGNGMPVAAATSSPPPTSRAAGTVASAAPTAAALSAASKLPSPAFMVAAVGVASLALCLIAWL